MPRRPLSALKVSQKIGEIIQWVTSTRSWGERESALGIVEMAARLAEDAAPGPTAQNELASRMASLEVQHENSSS